MLLQVGFVQGPLTRWLAVVSYAAAGSTAHLLYTMSKVGGLAAGSIISTTIVTAMNCNHNIVCITFATTTTTTTTTMTTTTTTTITITITTVTVTVTIIATITSTITMIVIDMCTQSLKSAA